jgi:hypothetical protein
MRMGAKWHSHFGALWSVFVVIQTVAESSKGCRSQVEALKNSSRFQKQISHPIAANLAYVHK